MSVYFALKSRQAPRTIVPALAALLLAGCVETGPSPTMRPAPINPSAGYIAQGNEPFWRLEISGDTLTYSSAYAENVVRENHGGAAVQRKTTHYVSPRLNVTIENARCDDTMIERSYRDTVTVIADGKNVKGCGGPILPPATLVGTSWEILAVDGTALIAEAKPALSFDDGRISGTAGCNNLMGGFTLSGAQLRFSQISLTRKACPAPLMQQEGRVVDALGKITRHEFTPDGRLHFYSDAKEMLTLRQIF